jgi:hypothetical protein
LAVSLSPTEIREINLRLESIAYIIQTSETCETGRSCGCRTEATLDEE